MAKFAKSIVRVHDMRIKKVSSETLKPYEIDVMNWSANGKLTMKRSIDFAYNPKSRPGQPIGVYVEPHQVTLRYRWSYDGVFDWTDERYPVALAWRANKEGHWLPWFKCPGPWCNRRTRYLYGGTKFRCHECYSLSFGPDVFFDL